MHKCLGCNNMLPYATLCSTCTSNLKFHREEFKKAAGILAEKERNLKRFEDKLNRGST